MDPIERKFATICWAYAEGDVIALAELEERVADAGRNRSLVT